MIVTGEENLSERVREITGGRGVVTAMDPVGGPGIVETIGSMAPGGRLLAFGLLDPRNDLSKGLPDVPGIELGLYTLFPVTTDPERREAAIKFIDASIADGTFKPVIDRTFDLSEYTEAHRYMESSAQFGKIVLTVQH